MRAGVLSAALVLLLAWAPGVPAQMPEPVETPFLADRVGHQIGRAHV